MYSLYRAWLSLGPPIPTPPSPPPLNLANPTNFNGAPDVTLQVGPGLTNFSAHKVVLSSHSGFFKAALINHTDSTPISVPNVNVDEFSSLLTFMYTGYLDLNLSNIYNILLATHILHMPRALEICRNFLLHSHQPTGAIDLHHPPPIIKPIPSRKSLLPTAQQQFYTPTFSNLVHLQKSESTPFKIVGTPSATTTPSRSSPIQQTQTTTSTVVTQQPPSQQQKTSETSSTISTDDKKSTTTSTKDNKHNKKKSSKFNDKVIIDIACCDGPVRFHRVLNKNYTSTPPVPSSQKIIETLDENTATPSTVSTITQSSTTPNNSQNPNDLFTCLYCNHTFKSQYCYQKHARRHLNPVTIEPTKIIPKEIKREVKLLDMNVQYYPCKTCGSKFPSYYFVHKHRKLCHAEEMDNTTAATTTATGVSAAVTSEEKSQQSCTTSIGGSTNDTTGGGAAVNTANTPPTDDSNCSAIDVEAINNDN